MRSPKLHAALVAAVLTIASSHAAGEPVIRIDDAWIRWLPAGVPAGGYARLTNSGDKPAVLIGAKSPDFKEISIHRSTHRAGSVQMEPVEQIIINPRSTLDFESLGYHLMLIAPARSLDHAAQVDVTLYFADGTSITEPFHIRKPVGSS